MLADDRAGGDYQKTGKFHESITHAAIFPIKTLSQVVTYCPAHQIEDSFKTLPHFASQNTTKIQAWDKHCQNRTGTKMGENECTSFRTRSRTCEYWQCLNRFSKFN